MKVFAMKNKRGEVNYFLRTPCGLVPYGSAKCYAIMGAGFRASWATAILKPRYSSVRAAKADGQRIVQSFTVEATYAL